MEKQLIKLQIIEGLKLADLGGSILADQIRSGLTTPASYNEVISNIWDQLQDNACGTIAIVTDAIAFLIFKYYTKCK